MSALLKFMLRPILLILASLTLLGSQPVLAQSGSSPQFLFAARGGNPSEVVTYSVDQTTGALTNPAGVTPAPIRTTPPSNTNQAALVNPAGTFLFIAGLNSNNNSAVSVLSISANGALAELAASPFSAGDATGPLALAISPDGQYLYELSGSITSPTLTVLDVYLIGSDGTLTPIGNYTLPTTRILYMHPTGKWLYAYGEATPALPTIQEFTVGPPGVLTNTGSWALLGHTQADALVGDSSGKYLFSLRNQEPGGVNLVDSLSVDGSAGDLTLLNTYSMNILVFPPSAILNANGAVDPTGGFLFTSFANFSLSNGIPALLQLNQPFTSNGVPLLLASRTSPFLFSSGWSDQNTIFLSSDVIGSGGSLTAAPGSPYNISSLGAFYALAVTGSVPIPTEPILTLSTTSINFPSTPAGQTATSTVTLSSTGFSTLLLNSISVSGDASYSQTNNCPNSMAAGSSCMVTVKFAPTGPGTFTGAVNINTNAPSVSIPLTGIAPMVAIPDLTPMTLTFLSTVVGVSSATQTFTIQNLPSATAPVQISNIVIGGSNPSDFSQTNNCSASLPVGGSCSVVVTFKPLAVGGRSATLSATTDDPNNRTLQGTMNGQGVASPQQFQLQTNVVGPGTIQESPSGTTFNANTSITLTAVPNANASFTSWSGACTGNSTNTVCTFSITANTTVTATFTANPTIGTAQNQQTGSAGTTFTFPIAITGFSTQPTLTASCSIPAGTCSISGTNLIVSTTQRSSGFALRDFPRVPGAFALAVSLLLLFASSGARKIVRRLALVGSLAFLAACQAGGGGEGTMQSGGTPAGTYTVTVHATAGVQTSTTTVTVVVQ